MGNGAEARSHVSGSFLLHGFDRMAVAAPLLCELVANGRIADCLARTDPATPRVAAKRAPSRMRIVTSLLRAIILIAAHITGWITERRAI